MSITFDILPNTQSIPKFSDVLDLCNKRLRNYSKFYELENKFKISLEIREVETDQTIEFNIDDLAQWDSEQYRVLFFVEEIPGCITVSFDYVDQLTRDIWSDEIEDKQASKEQQELIYKGLDIGYSWSFHRYDSRYRIYDLLLGVVAGNFTELTNGIINTDDGAWWDSSIFPAEYEDFFTSFFRPDISSTSGSEYQLLRCLLKESWNRIIV